ncbi:hypothetical protein LK994_11840 [Ferruginibacter lapsinanis]|uniref:DUF4350 domain-containing protein n=1 Tax=Ferruginibacter lapsinanis TaxID=563172 RepID=UPI001E63CFBA|nr:DUF4350 domain-containing protein [Ferruginibacter lapsinanis]UEG49324.1 hypothetical protein LK994_11840 [Ferruginibacter lapsinanis]
MPQFIRYYIFLFITIVMVAACNQQPSKLPVLTETFEKKDKTPFGTYITYNQMEQLYPHNTIFIKRQNFQTTWSEISDTKALYVSISNNVFLTKADVTAMLQYVYAGNTMFISGNNIDKKLLDTLGCSTTESQDMPYVVPELMNYTHVGLEPSLFNDSTKYSYFYYPLDNKFLKYDTAQSRVLGVNQNGKPNFILLFHGKGRFYLHLEPKAFSNYFLLQKSNYKYLQQALAFTNENPEQVFWDDFYCKKNYATSDGESEEGTFAMLTKYPPLKWALWLTLLLLALYILFGGKRRQRIIEVVKPNINTTVAFTETIGRLYLQSKNNRNIADKMILYFFEQIRTQYFLNTNHLNDEFIDTVSRKSNVSIEKTKKLFKTIHQIQNNFDVSDHQLLSLNNQIEHFNKTKI